MPFTAKLVSSNYEMFKHEWIWEKHKGSNFASLKYQPMKEHESVLVFCKKTPTYKAIMQERKGGGLSRTKYGFSRSENSESEVVGDSDVDELFDTVVEYVLTTGMTSISSIQRNFKLGFNRAARIVDQMEAQGILSSQNNGKREILAPRNHYE